MGISRLLLGDDEAVIVELRPHWVVLARPLASTLAGLALALWLLAAVTSVPALVALIVVLLPGAWLALGAARRAAASIVLTNQRIIERRGLLGTDSHEVRLSRVTELASHRSVAGRLLGFGDVQVEAGSERGAIVLHHVPRPELFQALVSEQVRQLEARERGSEPLRWRGALLADDTPPQGTPPQWMPAQATPLQGTPPRPSYAAADVAERLAALDGLRRQGLVSEEEFEAKRRELLRRL
jgi:hypothetical protein